MSMENGIINIASIDFVTFKNSQNLQARGTLLKLTRNNIVFEIYNPYSIVQLSEALSDLTVYRAEKQIYKGKAVVSNIVNTGIILVVSALLEEVSWKSIIDVRSPLELQREVEHLKYKFDLSQKIHQDFKANLLALRYFLSNLRDWLERLEPSFYSANVEVNADFMLKNLSSLFEKLGELCIQFHDSLVGVLKEDLDSYKYFSQNLLHQFFLSSPFPHRVYSKPLGYAGDYEMMKMIQRENAEGPNLYAKFINVFYTNIPIANSVKNRTDTLVRLIEEGVSLAAEKNEEFHALSIGCGPAIEVKRFLEKNNPKIKCNFKLIDFNKETLDFAMKQAKKAGKDKFCEISGELNSVHQLLKRSIASKEEEKYNFVYCSGLFDYLSDGVCTKLIKLFFMMIKPGGKVFVTNMHSNNKDNHLMELVFEWYLIYRDEKTMESISRDFKNKKLFTDSTGVNLCLEITK